MIDAAAALARLRDGNRRFVAGESHLDAAITQLRRADVAERQEPFAVILGCSDSRVPVEIIFDQGLGDLFVIRVAGNIIAPSLVGSVEFAAIRFSTRLVVVLGHTRCGAIDATLDDIQGKGGAGSRNLSSIVDRIRPSVIDLIESDGETSRDVLAERAVRANVRVSAHHLRHGSEVLERLIRSEGLCVVGAEYNLATGVVDFFDGAD
jgi:carbonic anhydrase